MNNHDLLNNTKPLLIFDGSCAFCTSCIRFVKKHDVNQQFDYADNNQIVTKLILAQHFIDSETLNTVVLIENNNVHIAITYFISVSSFLHYTFSPYLQKYHSEKPNKVLVPLVLDLPYSHLLSPKKYVPHFS